MKGILLINLGSPKDLELKSIKDYLKEFLSDDLVIDYPKFLQQILVNWIIIPSRYKNTREAYSEIWTENGSPLIHDTIALGEKVGAKSGALVEVSMRYQFPSIEEGLKKLKAKGCSEIFVVPLYPHYAMSTVLTTEREVTRIESKLGLDLRLNFIGAFYNEGGYISSLSDVINRNRQKESDYLLFSLKVTNCCEIESKAKPFCYKAQVLETSKLCAKKLELKDDEWGVSFQSRIGPGWIQPFTDKELVRLAEEGVQHLDVVCPAFVTDNLETLEEMNIRGRETFLEAGGKSFNYIPCLNNEDSWVDFLVAASEK
jgi:ferrochelatase